MSHTLLENTSTMLIQRIHSTSAGIVLNSLQIL